MVKIRRITLAVLLLLTFLFIADVRYFNPINRLGEQSSVHFDISPRILSLKDRVEKSQTFTRPQGQLTSLVVKGQVGKVEFKSTGRQDLLINATIIGEDEDSLVGWDVVEKISHSEISYELSGESTESLPEVVVDLVVEAPAGMDVRIVQDFGTVIVEQFVGFLDLETNFSNVIVRGLEGSAAINSQFGTLELKEIAGPLALVDSFSTSRIELVSIADGYNFDIHVTNGTLKGNAPLQRDTHQNMLKAYGTFGEGVHPVVINSSFGTVRLDLTE